jgi:hypothetical protein
MAINMAILVTGREIGERERERKREREKEREKKREKEREKERETGERSSFFSHARQNGPFSICLDFARRQWIQGAQKS